MDFAFFTAGFITASCLFVIYRHGELELLRADNKCLTESLEAANDLSGLFPPKDVSENFGGSPGDSWQRDKYRDDYAEWN